MRAGQGRQSLGDPRRRYCIFKSIFASLSSLGSTAYLAFCISSVLVLKVVNEVVLEPYMVSRQLLRRRVMAHKVW